MRARAGLRRCSPLRLAAIALVVCAASCINDTKPRSISELERAQLPGSPGISLELEALIAQAELQRAPSAALRDLLNSESVEVRARAALALGRVNDPDAVPALAKRLAHDGQDGANAAWALGRIHPEAPAASAANPAAPGPKIVESAAEIRLRECLQQQCAQEVEAARALGTAARSDEGLRQLALALERPANVAAQAALALGILARVGGKGADARVAAMARPLLWRALGRPESEVRRGAAYALGRIPRAMMPALQTAATNSSQNAASPASQTASSLAPQAAASSSSQTAAPLSPQSVAPPAVPQPVPLDEASKSALEAALRDPDPETRAAAARAAGKQGLRAEVLAGPLADPDWRVRVEAARALAFAVDSAALLGPALRSAALQLASAREASQASLAHPLVELFGSATALKLPRAELPAPETLSGPTAASTAAVRCAAAEARDRAADALLETQVCAAGLEPDWRSRFRTASLAGDLAGDHPESPAGKLLIDALSDTDPRVRSAAAGSASPAFAAALLERLDDPDAYVVASAAGSLAKDPAIARASLPDVARALQRLSSAREQPTGSPQADALAALVDLVAAALAPPDTATGSSPASATQPSSATSLGSQSLGSQASAPTKPKPYPLPPELFPLRPLFSLQSAPIESLPLFHSLTALRAVLSGEPGVAADLAAPARAPLPRIPGVAAAGLPGQGPRLHTLVLTTTVGELRVRLFTADDATPLTAAAIAALANQGFYDGLLWHRVVPDFVAQGGDPLGDGEGGPGWALPDEHTPLHFTRGSLGIATSGAETGGSQLFLCHSAQPHLDGRYTVAGQLESGEAALDALQVGDRILKARAE